MIGHSLAALHVHHLAQHASGPPAGSLQSMGGSCPRVGPEARATQVAAYTSGRLHVTTFDCLLLQHVLWQRPDEGPRIADYIMTELAADDGMQQAEYLLTGAGQL